MSRTVRTTLIAVVGALALAGCTGQTPDPKEYGDVNSEGEGYYGNFMYGCTGVEPTDGKYVDVKLESSSFCTCVFEGLKETVPFPDMEKFEKAQAEAEPGELKIPKNIDEVRQSCVKDASA